MVVVRLNIGRFLEIRPVVPKSSHTLIADCSSLTVICYRLMRAARGLQ
jgi:hypothetical protein